MKMNKKKKNILIIGAGVHGSFLAKYLSKSKKIKKIVLIEKNNSICLGSSNATHNRANRGFHYPRSKKTLIECKLGYEYFENNYNRFLKKIPSYYCIEKKSKTTFKKYKNFFKKNKLQFKEIKKNPVIINSRLDGIISGEEGCYNHGEIKKYLLKKLKKNKIKKFYKFNLKKVKLNKKNFHLELYSDKKKITDKFDYVINCTYDNVNKVNQLFSKKFNKKKYLHQLTEIVCVKSKRNLPGITVMDGPFITIMPHLGKKNEYLLYDVTNSILKTSSKPILIKKPKTNFLKMKKKLSNYMRYTNDLIYKKSIFGNRPIPINDKTSDRSTKIVKTKLKNKIVLISIEEGKYISAPYIAKKLSKDICGNE